MKMADALAGEVDSLTWLLQAGCFLRGVRCPIVLNGTASTEGLPWYAFLFSGECGSRFSAGEMSTV